MGPLTGTTAQSPLTCLARTPPSTPATSGHLRYCLRNRAAECMTDWYIGWSWTLPNATSATSAD
eukprot:13629415-Alexandrium_andersonii.AAC.1